MGVIQFVWRHVCWPLRDSPVCLAKGISAGLWVDLEAAWAFAFGRGVTCKRSWDYVGGSRRDFMVGCLRAAAAVSGSMVLEDRWILPHLFVRTLSIHGGFLGFLSWFLLMLVSFRGLVPDWVWSFVEVLLCLVLLGWEVSRAQLPGLVGGAWVLDVRRILRGVKRVRLHRKTPAHFAGFGRGGSSQSRPRVWKRYRGLRVRGFVTVVPRFRGCIRVMRLKVLRKGLGLGDEVGVARAHVPRLCMMRSSNLCSLFCTRMQLWRDTRIRHFPEQQQQQQTVL